MTTYNFIVGTFDFSDGAWGRVKHADLDTLMPLEDAVWTPEVRDGLGFPVFSTFQLRRAIESGSLKAMKPGHGYLTTRADG